MTTATTSEEYRGDFCLLKYFIGGFGLCPDHGDCAECGLVDWLLTDMGAEAQVVCSQCLPSVTKRATWLGLYTNGKCSTCNRVGSNQLVVDPTRKVRPAA